VYAIWGFELDAVAYLLKRISLSQYPKAYNKALELLDYLKRRYSGSGGYLLVRECSGQVGVPNGGMLYAGDKGNYAH
jgi:hypothetical protein